MRHRTLSADPQRSALAITTMAVLLLLLLLFLLRWKLPAFEKNSEAGTVEVEVNWPPDPPVESIDGGGGGGETATSIGLQGMAAEAPLPAGTPAPSAPVVTDERSESPAIAAEKIVRKKSKDIKISSSRKQPVAIVRAPAPPRPKAVMGRSTGGTANGGAGVDDLERTGGVGNGWGAGKGEGAGGGSGAGLGGGNGTGVGTGTGPRVTSGDRRIVKSYAFEGDLNKATVYATILVAPDGTGKLISIAKGSSTTGSAYKQAIVRYLEKMRFDAADHESTVTVQFNFRIN